LEATIRTNVEGWFELVDVGLERVPAWCGGVWGRDERVGAAEVVGLDKTESLPDELAWCWGEGRWWFWGGSAAAEGG